MEKSGHLDWPITNRSPVQIWPEQGAFISCIKDTKSWADAMQRPFYFKDLISGAVEGHRRVGELGIPDQRSYLVSQGEITPGCLACGCGLRPVVGSSPTS